KPREEFSIAAEYHPSNLPGKTVLVAHVKLPPNSATPPHRHGGATAIAIPVTGTSLNQMNGKEPKTYGPGGFWYEAPGCHHQRSEWVSGEEGATFIAVLIVDDETIQG
ncbi:cupin domain protein, partial [Amniculicola lignicola CBS 123094]